MLKTISLERSSLWGGLLLVAGLLLGLFLWIEASPSAVAIVPFFNELHVKRPASTLMEPAATSERREEVASESPSLEVSIGAKVVGDPGTRGPGHIRGQVITDAHIPLQALSVRIWDRQDPCSLRSFIDRSTSLDATGRFAFEGLPLGPYLVGVRDGYDGGNLWSVDYLRAAEFGQPTDFRLHPIDLRGRVGYRRIVIELPPGVDQICGSLLYDSESILESSWQVSLDDLVVEQGRIEIELVSDRQQLEVGLIAEGYCIEVLSTSAPLIELVLRPSLEVILALDLEGELPKSPPHLQAALVHPDVYGSEADPGEAHFGPGLELRVPALGTKHLKVAWWRTWFNSRTPVQLPTPKFVQLEDTRGLQRLEVHLTEDELNFLLGKK